MINFQNIQKDLIENDTSDENHMQNSYSNFFKTYIS